MSVPYINGAAEQGASVQRLPDDAVQIPGGFAEFVHLRNPSSKILKALGGAASGQGLVRPVQPEEPRRGNSISSSQGSYRFSLQVFHDFSKTFT